MRSGFLTGTPAAAARAGKRGNFFINLKGKAPLPCRQAAGVAPREQLAPDERLNPEKLMQDLKTVGKNAAHLRDVNAIISHGANNAQGGDILCVFSNGRFGGIHGKLLERLGKK